MNAVAEVLDTTIPSPIIFTDSAAEKVAQLIEEEGNNELKLRGTRSRTFPALSRVTPLNSSDTKVNGMSSVP